MNIDIKDIKIIFELMKNSRNHINSISKKVKLSDNSVKNRIEKLKKNGIIKAYKTNINFSILGFLEYDIYLKLKNYNTLELKKIIKIICEHRCVTWVGTCFGKYDLRISIIVKNILDINEFIEYVQKEIKNHFEDYKILYLLKKFKISQEKIIHNLFNIKNFKVENKEIIKNLINNENKFERLDNVEKKILKILNNDPQIHLVEIARKINLTPEACKYRIEELKKKGIITSFGTIIDGNKLNKIWSVFLFKINDENHKELINFIKGEKNVSAFTYMLGDWNYSISVFADSVLEIHNILMNFRNKFPKIIKEYELILLFETFKYPSLPDIVFE